MKHFTADLCLFIGNGQIIYSDLKTIPILIFVNPTSKVVH